MNHPGPWRETWYGDEWGPPDANGEQRRKREFGEPGNPDDSLEVARVLDANGDDVMSWESRDECCYSTVAAKRMMLAAPELLAMLAKLAHACNTRVLCAGLPELAESYALIARIEGRDGK